MPTKSSATGGFTGFSPAGLRFLRDLAKNNDRTWFEPRKEVYQTELQEPQRLLAADLSAALAKAKIPLAGDPRKAGFRIYRDVRFSHDKSPYKTNIGVYLPHDGVRTSPGGLYVHIQPEQCFLAVGFYGLEKAQLARWRDAMAADPKRFEAMLRAVARSELKVQGHGEGLKRMPRGFEAFAASPLAEYFKIGTFIVSEQAPDDAMTSRKLIDECVAITKKAKPLLDYGWTLLGA